MSKVTIAVAIVIDHGRVLVGRRSITATSAAGFHEFPGGKVKSGENPALAARRECQEETGLTIDVGPRLAKTMVADTGATILFFQASVAPMTAESPLAPFSWLTADDLSDCQFPPANDAVLCWLHEHLFRVQGGS